MHSDINNRLKSYPVNLFYSSDILVHVHKYNVHFVYMHLIQLQSKEPNAGALQAP